MRDLPRGLLLIWLSLAVVAAWPDKSDHQRARRARADAALAAGDVEAAADDYRALAEAATLNTDDREAGRVGESAAALALGHSARARALLESLERETGEPDSPTLLRGRLRLAAALGDREELRALLARARSTPEGRGDLGQLEELQSWLRDAGRDALALEALSWALEDTPEPRLGEFIQAQVDRPGWPPGLDSARAALLARVR